MLADKLTRTADHDISDACICSVQGDNLPRSLFKAGRNQLREGIGPVAHLMLYGWLYFAKGLIIPLGLENRVIAKSMTTAFGPNDVTLKPPFEILNMPIRPGE